MIMTIYGFGLPRTCLLFFTLALFPAAVSAQVPDSVDERILQIFNQDNALSDDAIEEFVAVDKPGAPKLDLNSATYDDLQMFPFLSDFQIKSLWQYLVENRPLLSIHELAAVPGFAKDDVALLSRYVETGVPRQRVSTRVRGSFWVKEQWGETRQGDSVVNNASYRGDNTRTLARLDCRVGSRYSVKACAEKDPGEAFGKEGFDFYSGSLLVEPGNAVKKVIVGDYSARFGQGIVLWSGSGAFSQMSAVTMRKREPGIRPYAGIDENIFLRGVAVNVRKQGLQFSVLCSMHNIDGNMADSTGQTISGFNTSGYHRTDAEILDRHSVGYKALGANGSVSLKRLRIEITGAVHRFDAQVVPASASRNLYSLRGNNNAVVGVDAFLNMKKVDLFSECGVDESRNAAFLVGSEANVSGSLGVALLYRDYSQGYNSFMSAAYSQGGVVKNERGMLVSLELKPDTAVILRASWDYYQHPWLTYSVAAPSDGYVAGLSCIYLVDKNQQISASTRWYEALRNQVGQDSGVVHIEDISRGVAKAQYQASVEGWKFRLQVAAAGFGEPGNPGVSVSQDVEYIVPEKWSASLRYCFFDATYENRVYVYEPDVRAGYNAMLYGEGSKFIARCSVCVMRHVTVTAKYARFNRLVANACTRDEVAAFIKYGF